MKFFENIIILILLIAGPLVLLSQTSIPGGYVSGNWDASGSPYIIQDDILVHPDSTLSVSEGTSVLFSGHYRLEVQGQLLVTGIPSQPVAFDRENDTISWGGIYFNTTDTSITDSSILLYGSISNCYQYPCLAMMHSGRLRITGFTIENGLAFRGSGINCLFSDPYFSDLLVRNNSSLDGGGMSIQGSSPVMKNCTFSQNSADGAGGGMVIFDLSNPLFENCTISNNQSFGSGGGIYINNSAPVFVGCQFINNAGAIGGSSLYSGGGVSVKLSSTPVFGNCTFTGNTSFHDGGGIASYSVTPLINCLFSSNTSTNWGGAVFLSTANISSPITNCTFSGNDASHGMALATHSHEAVINNCIFWNENPGNPNSMIFLDSQFSWNLLDISYSDLQNGENGIEASGTTQYTWGPGNIDLDPELIPESNELSWQSPCIEAGTPDTSGLGLLETDLSGNPRFVNTRIDMGAFEYQLPVIIPDSKFQIPDYFSFFPNPAGDYLFIRMEYLSENVSFQIINTEGLFILEGVLPAGNEVHRIGLNGFTPGLYLVILSGNAFRVSGKVVVNTF